MKTIKITFLSLVAACTMASCDFLEKEPYKITPENYFQNETEVSNFLTGIYANLSQTSFYGNDYMVLAGGDDLEFYGGSTGRISNTGLICNNTTTSDAAVTQFWADLYSGIERANMLLEHIDNVPSMSAEKTAQYKSEARFLRAFYYFNLVQCWGDVPLKLESTYLSGTVTDKDIARTDKNVIYKFIVKEMEEAARKSEEASKPGGMPEAEKIESQKQAESKMVLYTCPSCGAEIVAQETTASTYCCYCHNPVVLSGSLDGKYRPDGLIPFEIDKKKAKEIFKNWIQKKKYVPDDFYSPRQMEYLEGIYYPYWMYSCQVSGEMQAEALQKRVTVSGEIEYIETSRYHLEKKAELPIKDVARNALKQADRSLAETVLPFDMKKLRPFQAGYFLGFRAERRDREKEEFAQEIEQEIKQYTRESLQNSVSGYDHVDIRNHRETITGEKWNYAMLPVWMMTYPDPKSGQMYYFAMNGENGKVCGVPPDDSKKLARLFLTIFIPVFVLLLLGGYLI